MQKNTAKETTGSMTDFPLYLYHHGKNDRIYEIFGAHKEVRGEKEGYVFRVWAPHARSVSVGGDFNEWNVDANGMEYQRGMKAMTIPAHNASTCRDVLVKCIKFVVPEDLDVSGASTQAMCNSRNFKARFIAHTIDTDFRCCESVLTL